MNSKQYAQSFEQFSHNQTVFHDCQQSRCLKKQNFSGKGIRSSGNITAG